MKCPYCGKEMAVGYLHNHSQPVQWLPNGAMPSRIKWTIADNCVPLKNKYKFFKEDGYIAEAFYCKDCRIVIAPAE